MQPFVMAFTKKTRTTITENYSALIDHEALRELLEVPKGVSGFRVWIEVPRWSDGDLDIDADCPIRVQYDVVSVTDDPAPA